MIYNLFNWFVAQTIPRPVVPAFRQFLLTDVGAFFDFLSSALLAAICIAVVTAAGNHLLAPLIRKVNQRFAVAAWAWRRLRRTPSAVLPEWLDDALWSDRKDAKDPWLRDIQDEVEATLSSRPEELKPHWLFWLGRRLKSLTGLRTGSTILRDELFMHSVQSEAKAALAHPSENHQLFNVLTADAPSEARGAVTAFDLIASSRPDVGTRLSDFEAKSEGKSERNPIAAALGAAESTVSAAAQRALDELQLSLMAKAISTYRISSIAIGILVAALAQAVLRLDDSFLFLTIGAAGGSLALFISDAIAAMSTRFAK